jgi:hypothetical protein
MAVSTSVPSARRTFARSGSSLSVSSAASSRLMLAYWFVSPPMNGPIGLVCQTGTSWHLPNWDVE